MMYTRKYKHSLQAVNYHFWPCVLDWKEFYCWRGRPVEEEQFGVASEWCVYATHME